MSSRSLAHLSRTMLVAGLLSLLGLTLVAPAALGAPAPSPAKSSSYKVGGSCTTHGPYKRTTTCRYPTGGRFTTTFLFKSKVGAQKVKVCNQISGSAIGSHHSCVTLKGKTSRKLYPFRGAGLHGKVTIKLVWSVKGAGGYQKVGSVRQTLVPR